jgi:hypothetical protein
VLQQMLQDPARERTQPPLHPLLLLLPLLLH